MKTHRKENLHNQTTKELKEDMNIKIEK